jgi:hypothetical protein
MSSEFPSCFGTERVRMMHGCWTPKVDTLVPSSGLCGSENWQFAPQFMAKKTDNTAKHRDFVWGSFFVSRQTPFVNHHKLWGSRWQSIHEPSCFLLSLLATCWRWKRAGCWKDFHIITPMCHQMCAGQRTLRDSKWAQNCWISRSS